MTDTKIIDEYIWNALRHLIVCGTDPHLARCDLAKRSGPHATLACAECGRARWMHATRHDTCGQFRWVITSVPDALIEIFQRVPSIDQDVAVACSRALHGFGLSPALVRHHRRTVVAAINAALNRYAGPFNAGHKL